jgi:mannose-1-phosphate guanylyltransferase
VRAIILIGGEGTRLLPLSTHTPKQLVPILNHPLLEYLLLHLRGHGVEHVTLATTRTPGTEAIRTMFGDGTSLGLDIEYAYEETPLGSGGAIASVATGWEEPFLVANGDILTDLDVTAMLEDHHSEGAELSIFVQAVDEPSRFGVAVLGANDNIVHFVEKPQGEAPSNLANAGIWLFQPSLLAEMDSTRHNMLERELFPRLAGSDRDIFGFQDDCYWIDVGTPESYLKSNLDLLAGAAPTLLPDDWPLDSPDRGVFTAGASISNDASIDAPALIGAGSEVHDGAHLAGPVSLGANCIVQANATVAGSVLWDGVTIDEGATVRDSILASGVTIGAGTTIDGAVLAQGATVEGGATVPAGTSVEANAHYPSTAAAP